jgi:putative flippase GtrA
MIDQLKSYYNKADTNHPKKMKIMRYIISGGMATVTNVLFLFIFTDLFGFWYVLSAVIAYLISFIVSFTMQKYWTFRDSSNDRMNSQIVSYIILNIVNLGLNTLGIFLFVHYGHVYYLLAQIIVSVLIAIESFYIYSLVFKSKEDSIGVSNPI